MVVEDKGERKSNSKRQRPGDVSLHAPSHASHHNLLTIMTARMDVLRSHAVWVARKPRPKWLHPCHLLTSNVQAK